MGNRRRFNLGDVIESIHSITLAKITDIRMATMEYTFETYPASDGHKYVERWHDVDSNFVLCTRATNTTQKPKAKFKVGDHVVDLDSWPNDVSGFGRISKVTFERGYWRYWAVWHRNKELTDPFYDSKFIQYTMDTRDVHLVLNGLQRAAKKAREL